MIFCVDDDPTIRDIEVYALEQTGFHAKGFPDGASLFEALKKEQPRLIVLDVMLPGPDGIEILKELKKSGTTKDIPVIMATAKGTEIDRIHGLDTGADDYLVKPFGVMEMVSRIKAVLRRCEGPEDENAITVGNTVLKESTRTLTVNGEPAPLTLKEFEILRLFMKNLGVVFSRDRLLSEVWGIDFLGETRTVDMHIVTLRKKIKESDLRIDTVIGVGYRGEIKR